MKRPTKTVTLALTPDEYKQIVGFLALVASRGPVLSGMLVRGVLTAAPKARKAKP
ncbi:MAG: hypothetical protein JW751_08625 [Polyangiaceae bacterium]|nr:hypothetical protein [Polyangiaceae bacterium]